jgi:hypothetical protein
MLDWIALAGRDSVSVLYRSGISILHDAHEWPATKIGHLLCWHPTVVGVRGFEPPACTPRTQRSTWLGDTPNQCVYPFQRNFLLMGYQLSSARVTVYSLAFHARPITGLVLQISISIIKNQWTGASKRLHHWRLIIKSASFSKSHQKANPVQVHKR